MTREKDWKKEARKLIAENMTVMINTFLDESGKPEKTLIQERDKLLNFIQTLLNQQIDEYIAILPKFIVAKRCQVEPEEYNYSLGFNDCRSQAIKRLIKLKK